MSSEHVHASHPKIANRLKRAGGHLQNVIAMMGDGKPCLDIVQQLQAVERAIVAAKKALIHDHIDHCLVDATKGQTAKTQHAMDEFKNISKYL